MSRVSRWPLKIGIVKSLDNQNDEKRKNRILVSFLNESSECYASMMYNYFGEEFGHVWYPDPGTIVVVAFLEDCIDGAIIIGFLNQYEKDLLPINTENNDEVFKHKNGANIKFSNKEGDTKIIVSTKDEQESLSFDLDNEKVEIKNKDDSTKLEIDFKESKMSLKFKTIEIEVDESMKIKSKKTEIDSGDKFSLKASGTEINSSGNLKLESGSGTDIKSSGMVNIN